MNYLDIPAPEAHRLICGGGLVLVCTKDDRGGYDIAPVAWTCPLDYEPTSRVLFVCDPHHQTFKNIEDSRAFALALPTPDQRELVKRTGSVSGRDTDKFKAFSIGYFSSEVIDVRIPESCAGWLECRHLRTVSEGSSSIVLGEVVHAKAVAEAWKLRLHYVSENLIYTPGERI
jgi:flavin reductase (DIM6/NTAB) family NADH-FMN oxidoreductase RutF